MNSAGQNQEMKHFYFAKENIIINITVHGADGIGILHQEKYIF